MASDWSGRWFIDGKDVWISYGLIVESGSDGFLEYPATKPNISHDWPDQHGVDVDLTKMFLQAREISLRCGIIANDENDFWAKYKLLINDLTQPGNRRIEYSEFGAQSFFVYYTTTNNFTRLTRLKDGTVFIIACKFTLVLNENEPQLDASNVFIVEETGKFLIT